MLDGLGADPEIAVVALVDVNEPGRLDGARHATSLDEMGEEVDVVVDFSNVATARSSIEWCLEHNTAAVIGATGFTPDELDDLAKRVGAAGGSVIVASNFSIGAVLTETFAAQAARHFDRVEIIELHHDKKVDAPSGTSLATARAIAAARTSAGRPSMQDVTELETIPHGRGADAAGGVRVHSVRLPGLVAHQEVIFGRPGEGLTIRHDSFDRASFVGGVLLAVKVVRSRPGLTVGISELV
jgi:4-hydroxy-tetrahydrodipicolinate reductase